MLSLRNASRLARCGLQGPSRNASRAPRRLTTQSNNSSSTNSSGKKLDGQGFMPNVAPKQPKRVVEAPPKMTEPDDNILPPLQLWKFFRVSGLVIFVFAAGKALGLDEHFEEFRTKAIAEQRVQDARQLELGMKKREPKDIAYQFGTALALGAVVGLGGGIYFARFYKPRRHKAVVSVLEHLNSQLGAPEIKPLGRVHGKFQDNNAKFSFETRVNKNTEMTVSAEAFRDAVEDKWKVVKVDFSAGGRNVPLSGVRALRNEDSK